MKNIKYVIIMFILMVINMPLVSYGREYVSEENVANEEEIEKIGGNKYWVGWRKWHYNFTATPTARK